MRRGGAGRRRAPRFAAAGYVNPAILVLNAGSSSIKFLLFAERAGALEPKIRGQIEGISTAPRFVARDHAGAILAEKSWDKGAKLGHGGAIEHLAGFLRGAANGLELRAVGHRVVHGGLEFTQPVRLDAQVLAKLEKFVPLAPLHQPHNLAPVRALLERQPDLAQVACFDTAFHATNPEVARRFAIPAELHDAGVRRYGFHGLSYEYIASVLP
jgi:acetate kinase